MKSRILLYHIAFWISIYALWVLVFRSYSFSITKTMTIEFCYLLFITADFYAINNFIVPRLLLKKHHIAFGLFIILIITLSAWLRALVSVQINLHVFHTIPTGFGTLFLNSVVNISVWVLAVTIIKMLIDRVQTQQQLELLEKESLKSELDYLKAQINPHALLNSLNTIYGHIDKSNQTARDVLLKFSELLKYQLYECSTDKVDLEKEINYITNYVAFQKLRKDEKLVMNFDAGNMEQGLKIAPLLLVVIIENAFKFVSTFADKINKIDISLYTKDGILYCTVSNTTEIQESIIVDNAGGIGISNLKRRLELLYAQKYKLDINNGPEYYQTNLSIDLI